MLTQKDQNKVEETLQEIIRHIQLGMNTENATYTIQNILRKAMQTTFNEEELMKYRKELYYKNGKNNNDLISNFVVQAFLYRHL
ncbi:hypothetical protein TetV_338 [Tetraselmis virus 1]|uniref:Uncharacterized protein n=1 Tax=Tetraselmis virus 1 TaxID=2060617 RepID=A0A2P0VNI7_9VIRU|nr:hypothetical protein QJ968_gp338 [Tetraselmis virus 1]AUF82430.1 hypothetical protein TetV_338 [Tetraselmis virus 1]